MPEYTVTSLMLLTLLLFSTLTQDSTPTILYRMVQGGSEVGRETYRRSAMRLDRTLEIPLLNMRLTTQVEFDAQGRMVRFAGEIYNTRGDTLRNRFEGVVHPDSVVATVGRTEPRRLVIRGRAEGFIPNQTVSTVAEAAARARGRDTTFRFAVLGVDTTVPVRVSHRNDSTTVTMAGVTAYLVGRDPTIRVPGSALVVSVWNGVDSLLPLAGLRRPVVSYNPPVGASYTAEHVRITIRPATGDTFSLAATLSLPIQGSRPFPAVVMMSGSGQQDRDENLWPVVADYRPFREYAERLAREGIAVLRYDDRTAGESGGALGGTTEDYTDDVRQLVAWLRSRPDIDASRIGLVGHSEGGVMGPLLAVTDLRFKALVILAGPSKAGRAVVRDQFVWPLRDLPADERAREMADVERRLDEWMAANAWTKWFATYDPASTARQLRLPVLIQHGALDRQVSVGQADSLAAIIRSGGNRDVTVKIYPRLNHLFLPTDGDGSPSEYGALRQVTLPLEVLDDTARWLALKLKAPG